MAEDTEQHRTRRVAIRVTDGELRLLRATAKRERCTVSDMVRECVAERWLSARARLQRTGADAD
jgi:hypothetical protein